MPDTVCERHADLHENQKELFNRTEENANKISNTTGRIAIIVGIGVCAIAYALTTFASKDRVDGIENRLDDVRSAMRSGFSEMDKKQDRILSMLIDAKGDK